MCCTPSRLRLFKRNVDAVSRLLLAPWQVAQVSTITVVAYCITIATTILIVFDYCFVSQIFLLALTGQDIRVTLDLKSKLKLILVYRKLLLLIKTFLM